MYSIALLLKRGGEGRERKGKEGEGREGKGEKRKKEKKREKKTIRLGQVEQIRGQGWQ